MPHSRRWLAEEDLARQEGEDATSRRTTSMDHRLGSPALRKTKTSKHLLWTAPEIIRGEADPLGTQEGDVYRQQNLMNHVMKTLKIYASSLEAQVEERMDELKEEKKKSDALSQVAERLKLGQKVEPESREIVTVFFSDVVGFTTIASKDSPMQSSHIYIYKNFRVPYLPSEKVNIRVGLHSGPVVAGVVGIAMPRYGLFGDTVNTASHVVEWLLALQPSSMNSASHAGRTCLHLAAAQGNLEMVVLLCTKGCFVNSPMLYKDNLYTPLDVAQRKNHEVVVDYLSKKYEAKSAAEIPEEERQKNRLTFEEQLVQDKALMPPRSGGKDKASVESSAEVQAGGTKAPQLDSSPGIDEEFEVTNCSYNARALAFDCSIEGLLMQARRKRYDAISLAETRRRHPLNAFMPQERNCSLELATVEESAASTLSSTRVCR
ncbi:unnamed protein product [Angiostrongylus costaricensis]|uniref:ANK_REP_REGION domain-containing protein n=1 Tax=Angiostrongylus costaricensis TaxID=334426 RepID=A0A158PM07_ANGCS|nr:unnamed protein product [Angiostrongylus costaricensis]